MKIHVIKVKGKCLFLKLSKKKVKLIWGHDNAFYFLRIGGFFGRNILLVTCWSLPTSLTFDVFWCLDFECRSVSKFN